MAKWGKPKTPQYRKAAREYARDYRRKYLEKSKAATLHHYYQNREKLLKQEKERRNKHQQIVNEARSSPCMDCGVSYPPYVMDFDHVRGRKMFQIGGSMHLATARIRAEIAKCDVVCSNCHRKRTFGTRRACKNSL